MIHMHVGGERKEERGTDDLHLKRPRGWGGVGALSRAPAGGGERWVATLETLSIGLACVD
jgi:hypothetical protein